MRKLLLLLVLFSPPIWAQNIQKKVGQTTEISWQYQYDGVHQPFVFRLKSAPTKDGIWKTEYTLPPSSRSVSFAAIFPYGGTAYWAVVAVYTNPDKEVYGTPIITIQRKGKPN